MMEITKKLKMDILEKQNVQVVYAVQNDANTRGVELNLFSGGFPWVVPDGVSISVAYRKPDKTSGWYDKLPDGSDAYSVDGNAVTITFAPQVMTVAGLVKATVIFQNKENLNQIAVFPFDVVVEENPASGNSISNSYYNYSTLHELNEALGGFLSMDNCVVYGANLASLGEVVEGYFVSPTTGNPTIAPNSKYTTIPIPDGKELTVGFGCHIYAFEASNTGGVSFWDKDMNNLGVFDVANYKIAYTHNGYPCATIPIPDGAAFVRCTTLLWNSNTNSTKWDATDTLFVALGNADDAQNPRIATIGGYVVCTKKETAEKKKWALIGDSLTAVNTTAAMKYHDYVAQELNLLVSNHARSGAGFTSGTVFSSQIAELAQEDCDVITIFTSGNDCDNDPPLGTVTDTGSDTLCGVINTTLDELFALKPFVSVGIITSCPWKWFMPSTPGNLMENYNNAIMEIARRRGIPVLDLYHSSNMHPDDEGFRVKFYNENGVQDNGVHPNSEGHKILAAPIREFVRSLIRP